MKYFSAFLILSFWSCTGYGVEEPTVATVTHRTLQAVDEAGLGTYVASDKVVFQGIVLNSPEEILDPTPGEMGMGSQWQMYIQGQGDDHAGTAVWFGQNYSIVVSSSSDYTDEEVLREMWRINTDPTTGYIFNAGDLVQVSGWYKFYKGKMNLNEKHQKDVFYDFTIELVQPAVGLPVAEVITLDQVKDGDDVDIFDPNQLSGGEYYQGCLVRINDVSIVDTASWGPNQTITIIDSSGRTCPVLLGLGEGISRYVCPTGTIDVIGIFDQEASGYYPCKDGYRIWVPDYDGNGLVLTDRGHRRGNLPGDVNTDFQVDLADFSEMAAYWMSHTSGLSP